MKGICANSLAVSIKDKIDPQILLRIEAKLDHILENFDKLKAGMIFARKTTSRSRLDLEYLDETSSRKLSSRNQQDDGQKKTRPLRQFADYALERNPGPGSRGRISAPLDFDQRGRQPYRAVATH